MFLRTTLPALPLAAFPAVSAESSTGINSVGPAVFFFSIAFALILSLLFRKLAFQASAGLQRRLGQWRLRDAIREISQYHLQGGILPGAYGGLVRLDQAILTPAGFFCFKVLHRSGTVFGDADDPQWTLVDGDSRQRFLNPVIQNEGRCRAIRRAIADEVPVINVVLFTGRVQFEGSLPKNVLTLNKLRDFYDREVFGPAKVEHFDETWHNLTSAIQDDPESERDFNAQVGFC